MFCAPVLPLKTSLLEELMLFRKDDREIKCGDTCLESQNVKG